MHFDERLKFRKGAVSFLVIWAMWNLIAAAQAQSLTMTEVLSFDIAPQKLETALESFGEQSRLQVLYETSLTDGRRSEGVKGHLTREVALREVLAKTGLDFSYTVESAFTIVPMRMTTVPAPAVANYTQFLGGVQAKVLSVLCKIRETRPGAFRLAFQFSIGHSGQIENPRLLGSTGIDQRDTAIVQALHRVALGALPPSNMPQPITMVLWPGPDDARDECPAGRP